MINKRKKFFAEQRATEQRSKPLTKAQVRNKMCVYLKNIGRFTHNQLKHKSFEEVQKLFDKEQKWIKDFVPMDLEVDKSSKKRAGLKLEQASSKRQKVEVAEDTTELKRQIDIDLDDGDEKDYFQIFRIDGTSQMYMTMRKMLKKFDREDLEALWSLVEARHENLKLMEYM
ncbi:hypothetical protein Tco_1170056 [Tanacetum coccineum]